MKDWIDFFKTKAFAANLAVAVVIVLVVSILSFKYLSAITHHGVKVKVPVLVGKQMAEVEQILDEADLNFVIIDSVFQENMAKGAVVSQLPEANDFVKDGRTIYLTINASNKPKVEMPELVNKSLRQAVATLEALGLKYETVYQPDICTDCVLAQTYRGKAIVAGVEIAKGETITLTIGSGGQIPVDSSSNPVEAVEPQEEVFE